MLRLHIDGKLKMMNDDLKHEREQGCRLFPKYDANGLICAVITDASNNNVLMVAYMNEAALKLTLDTGRVHFYSRSRQSLWLKGETSGNFLEVVETMIDCDQDALWIKARPAGPVCHTGAANCFYRVINKDGGLERRN